MTVNDYRVAAEQGDAAAQFDLGYCYASGNGVEENYTQAVYWWKKAAQQGDANAQFELANCYYLGKGVEEDNNMALYWYEQAYKNGVKLDSALLTASTYAMQLLRGKGYSSSLACPVLSDLQSGK